MDDDLDISDVYEDPLVDHDDFFSDGPDTPDFDPDEEYEEVIYG